MLVAVLVVDVDITKASPWWLWGTYGVITIGELFLSPMGLSLVSRMSPVKLRAFMMGGWFLSTAIGNKMSGIFGEVYTTWRHDTFFIMNAAVVGAAAAIVFILLPWLNRQMTEHGAEPEKSSSGEHAQEASG
jgi:POT family proton-dependent oligopeptide transporter